MSQYSSAMLIMVEAAASGSPIREPAVRKRTSEPQERDQLLHEASVLALAHGRGVAPVINLVETDEDTELTVELAGDRCPLPGSLGPRAAAAFVGQVAATVARLHEQGICHGRISLACLVVDAETCPILSGFDEAFVHDGSDPDRFARGTAADVAALGELLTTLLTPGADTMVLPQRRHHLSADERRASDEEVARRTLLTLADQAAAAAPENRPTAAALSSLLAQAVDEPSEASVEAEAAPRPPSAGTIDTPPGAGQRSPSTLVRPAPLRRLPSLPDLSALGARLRALSPRSLPLRSAGVAAAVLAGIALLAGSVLSLRHGPRPSHGADAAVTGTVPASSSPSGAAANGAACPSVAQPATAISAGACPVPIRVDGRIVEAGDHRFELGEPGDVVAVGPFRCDGDALPALLRPTTGEVFVFDRWAAPGHDVSVQPLGAVPGATALVAEELSNGCATLVATRADGTSESVPLTAMGIS